MVELLANNGDPDQTPRSLASDLGLHCLPVNRLGISSLHWAKWNEYAPFGEHLAQDRNFNVT